MKLADFGSCRSTHSKPPFTEYIATRWYRSPECLLTEGHYGAPMDIWGAGCVLFEITALFPLFPGADEVDQINRIHKVVGTPSKDVLLKLKRNKSSKMDFKFREQSGVGIRHFIPHASIECINLLNRTLEYDFNHRIASRAACDHEYFDSLRVGQKTARKGSSNSSPTSVRNPHGKDARDEKPISYRQRGVEKNPPQRVIKAKKTESRTAVHKVSLSTCFITELDSKDPLKSNSIAFQSFCSHNPSQKLNLNPNPNRAILQANQQSKKTNHQEGLGHDLGSHSQRVKVMIAQNATTVHFIPDYQNWTRGRTQQKLTQNWEQSQIQILVEVAIQPDGRTNMLTLLPRDMAN